MEPNFSFPLEDVHREGRGFASSFLHTVRKPSPKPWKKPAIGPQSTRVYVVDPHGFRQLVQELTGAPESSPSRRLREAAPRPLDIISKPKSLPQPECGSNSTATQLCLTSEPIDFFSNSKPSSMAISSAHSASSSIGLLSPSSYYSICSFPLLSPGTMASIEQGTAL